MVPVSGGFGFEISCRRYRPDETQSWHEHRDAHLVMTVCGGFTEQWQRQPHECTPTTALLRPGGEVHANRYCAEGTLCVVVRLDGQWPSALDSFGIGAGCHHATELSPLASRLYREIHCRDSAAPLAAQAIVYDLMSRLARRGSAVERRAPAWIYTTIDLLQSRLTAPPGVAEAARLAGVHPAHLSRTFRRFTGLTMGEYVRRERIARASDRLRRTNDPLATIAVDAGFYDQAHFSRTFRDVVGMSPREFRRTNRPR